MDELEEIRKRKMQEMVRMTESKENGWPKGVIEVTDSTLDETAAKYPVMLLDCWAQWCGFCHKLAPVIEELAEEYHGKIAFAKMDMDANQGTGMKYGIRGLPTMLLFRNGKAVDALVGYMPKANIEARLKEHIG